MVETDQANFTLLKQDIPESVVDSFLDKIGHSSVFEHLSEKKWQNLTQNWPNLRQFITTISTSAAPEDPIAREQNTRALHMLLALLDRARTIEELKALWENTASPSVNSL